MSDTNNPIGYQSGNEKDPIDTYVIGFSKLRKHVFKYQRLG